MQLTDIQNEINTLVNSNDTPIGLYRFATRLAMLMPHMHNIASGFSPLDGEGPGKQMFDSRCESGPKVRDVMFHLEALCRVYRKTHSKDAVVFEALKNDFKEIEDGLGRIDYYLEMRNVVQELGAPPAAVGYFTGGYHAELQNLSKRLKDSGWFLDEGDGVTSPALERILGSLTGVRWKKPKKDWKTIVKFYSDCLEKVLEKGGARDSADALNFEDLEHGVHEFRRTARWVSIYPQALGGLCQLVGKDRLEADLAEYHTPEVTSADFTNYPSDAREPHRIEIEASYMFGFSYVIEAIGQIKDDGQLAEALELAIGRTSGLQGHALHEEVQKLLGTGRIASKEIPAKVAGIVDGFLNAHRVPQRLQDSVARQLH
jgi:hypothetical protein